MELSEEIVGALARGHKIKAIKSLRESTGLSLAEAKALVESYELSAEDKLKALAPDLNGIDSNKNFQIMMPKQLWVALPVVSFVWAFVNIVDVIGSAIILCNISGYHEAEFVVSKVEYSKSHEDGLSWGLAGYIGDKSERLYAPQMADESSLGLRGLRNRFPEGAKLIVWYNPDVTGELFQHRSLRVVPQAGASAGDHLTISAVSASEWRRIGWWIKFCLLPWLVVVVISRKADGGLANAG